MLTRVVGGLPLSITSNCEDLPGGVARDLARWSRSATYFGNWEGHARLAIPIRSYSFRDDLIAPPDAVRALLSRYSRAGGQLLLLDPPPGARRSGGHGRFFQQDALPGNQRQDERRVEHRQQLQVRQLRGAIRRERRARIGSGSSDMPSTGRR